ncbi:hypothetical protein COLO4_37596 [Corchorus olitorius]|uniref:Uncharacterized protein n=1 Tax=Corchorus olitorius TaxID=93759 RepID=A0A1R3G0P0_9ROSI|nr:hypothetical protein COLO4_37596 [Corchorus olitorius]
MESVLCVDMREWGEWRESGERGVERLLNGKGGVEGEGKVDEEGPLWEGSRESRKISPFLDSSPLPLLTNSSLFLANQFVCPLQVVEDDVNLGCWQPNPLCGKFPFLL